MDFIYAVYCRNPCHCRFQFPCRVYQKINRTTCDIILSSSLQPQHIKVELFCNAVHKVTQKVVSVNSLDFYAYRIRKLRIAFKIHVNYRVAVMRRQADCLRAVSLMYSNPSVLILEAYHLFSWKRIAFFT